MCERGRGSVCVREGVGECVCVRERGSVYVETFVETLQ